MSSTVAKAPKFTRKVKRGLVLMRGLLIDSFNDDASPSRRQVASWPRKDQDDFNTAMAWLESIEAQQEAPQEEDQVQAGSPHHNESPAGAAPAE